MTQRRDKSGSKATRFMGQVTEEVTQISSALLKFQKEQNQRLRGEKKLQ